jgi:peroxiredoxin Q/BCP
VILGASPDKPSAQKNFQDKFSLPFDLLCDTDKTLAKSYEVWKEKNMYGKIVMGIERTTFIIGPDGKVVKVFPKVKADGHADKVLEFLG